MESSDLIALAAAVISGLALLVTIVSAVSNRRYTRTQIALTQESLAASTEQFDRANKPDVHIAVITRLNPVEARGVYVKVTNNHPSIPVGDLQMWLEAPGSDGTRTWLFEPLDLLQPHGSAELGNAVKIHQMIEHFTGDRSLDGAVFSGPTDAGSSSDSFALTLRFSYVPRQEGANKVEDSLECHLDVVR